MSTFMQPIAAEELIAQSSEAIEAIKTAAGFRDVHFQHLCMPVIRAFALHVQRLPLAKDGYRDAGGAWELGLTASTVALRYAETQLFFPRLESEERRKIEPQCRFASFAAVLASVVALQAQNAVISSGIDKGEDDYHVLISPTSLYAFLAEHKQAAMTWRTDGHILTPAEAAAIASKFMPSGLLAQFDLRISQMFFGAIAPQAAPNGLESTLAKVVRVSIGKVIERYMQRDSASVGATNASAGDGNAAQAIGDALVAAAKPRELINPLDPATPAAAASTPAAPSPPPTATTMAAAPTSTGVAAPASNGASTDALLAAASPVLRDWFAALRKHERYPALKTHLVRTDRGTEVPINMLGFFGVSGPAIRKMMTDAGMVIDRSADHRAVILHPALNTLLFEE